MNSFIRRISTVCAVAGGAVVGALTTDDRGSLPVLLLLHAASTALTATAHTVDAILMVFSSG
ncbi:MAG: hypothetical protein O9284_17305 [Steroidobacteraceae bacterium]|nr:hypothetical protein [Steroidobacteraceae bacterium]